MARVSRARLVGAAVTIGALALFAHAIAGADPGVVLSHLRQAGPLVVLALPPFAIALLLEAAAWRQSLAALGRDVPLAGLVRVRLASEAILLTAPGGAIASEAVKIHLASRRLGVPAGEAVATMAIQKCLVVTAHAVYMAAAAWAGFGFLTALSPSVIGGAGLPWLVVGTAGALLAIAILLWLLATRAAPGRRLLGLLRRLPLRRLEAWLRAREAGFTRTDRTIRTAAAPRRSLLALAFTIGAWFAEAIESFILATLLGLELPFASMLAIEAIISVLRVAAFFVPRGLGVSDVGYVGLLAAAGGAPGTGAAFVVLKRARDLVWAGAGWWCLLRRPTEPRGAIETTGGVP